MSIIKVNTRSLPDSAVTTAKIAADAVTDAKIADDVVGTEHLTAGEVDATALGADSVTAAKINNDIISGSTELASEPADTDEFLVSDAGTLKRIDYSLIKGGGAYEKLVTTSITSGAVTNIEFNNTYITSTYRDYRIVCSNFEVSADSELRMTISSDNGSSFKSGSYYRYASRAFKSDATTNNRTDSGNTNFIITADNMKDGGSPSDRTSSIIIDIFDPLNTTTFFSAAWRGFFTSSSSLACGLYGGGFYNAGASQSFDAVKLVLSSGNFELGSYTLYGRKI